MPAVIIPYKSKTQAELLAMIAELTAKMEIIQKERKALAELNSTLYDYDGAPPNHEGEAELEAKMWEKECEHTQFAYELRLARIWLAKHQKSVAVDKIADTAADFQASNCDAT